MNTSAHFDWTGYLTVSAVSVQRHWVEVAEKEKWFNGSLGQ